jgi:protein involved in polysaccharide export with SLBB domain
MRSVILLAVLVVLSGPGAPAAAQDATAPGGAIPRATPQGGAEPDRAELLRPGDAVRITVWRKPEISGEYLIAADGAIADPFYMDVTVAGLPLSALIDRIRAHVAYYETAPRVLVEPLYRIAISGEVRQPSLYSVPPSTTVEQAILMAGGLTERARATRILLVRDDGQIELDVTRHAEGFGGTTLRSADQVVVPRRASILRDYVAPASSVIAASFSIISVVLRAR